MYCLPDDTNRLMGNTPDIVDNFALRLNKIVRVENGSPVFYRRVRNQRTIDEFSGFNFSAAHELLQKAAVEIREGAAVICANNIKVMQGETEWRMVVGLGVESVYETSMTLHHVLGIPYIPGQAVKGLVRNYILAEKFEGKEYKAITESEVFCYLFGCPKEIKDGHNMFKSALSGEHAGAVVFFDALPVNQVKLEIDIMTPHYGGYYNNASCTTPPADYLLPNPIPFLTVKGTKYQFIIGQNRGSKKIYRDKTLGEGTLLELAEKYLMEASGFLGFGAKSAAGYGYLKMATDESKKITPLPEDTPLQDRESELRTKYAETKIAKEAILPAIIASVQGKSVKARVLHEGITGEISFTVKGTVAVGQFVKVRIADIRNGIPVTFTLNGIIT